MILILVSYMQKKTPQEIKESIIVKPINKKEIESNINKEEVKLRNLQENLPKIARKQNILTIKK